jgi:YVTN family beta-propeller protein
MQALKNSLAFFISGLLSAAALAAGASGRQPIYVGARVCGQCHAEAARGHQFNTWRLTPHARAFAVLSNPEAKTIADLSGIPEEPQKARMCLGCHATASEAEDWEKAETFHIEDGLQCETCHGPGSEYADRDIMKDREKAMAQGLIRPDKDSICTRCHRTKGSHEAVLKRAPFDSKLGWRDIAHPIPNAAAALAVESTPVDAPVAEKSSGQFKFTGVMTCAQCHQTAKMNGQFSKWRQSKHAQAYAVLTTPRGFKLAKEAGVQGDPQKSAKCLACHTTGAGYNKESFLESFDFRDGVQCESCHGPGSDYSAEAVMLDKTGAKALGLVVPDAKTCQSCHEKAHGKPFLYERAVKQISHPIKQVQLSDDPPPPQYKTPLNLAITPDGQELWVACEAGNSVIVVDTRTRQKVAEIPVGGQPHDVTFDPQGRRAFVANRLDDSLSVVEVKTRQVIATVPVGDEPHGVLLDKPGKYIYVLNSSIDDISVLDAATLKEIKRLSASRDPWSLALSPDGSQILVTHALSRFVRPLKPSLSEVTVIDTARAVVEDRIVLPGANLVQGVAWHPSGDYGLVTLLRTKNLLPMTRAARGWTIANGLGVIWRDGAVDQVMLDQPNLGFPDPADVIITPDGQYALVTSSSSDRVAVLDLGKLIAILKSASPQEREQVLPNHLGKSVEFTVKYIPTKNSPRGLTCSADGAAAYVANALDDSITVIDLKKLEAVDRIDLGGPRELSQARRGERVFNSAHITFHRQFSCHTCHPDGHIDGITYDTEPDGIGISPVDNRTLRGINDMAPYKWEGTNPSLRRQCGPRLSVFFTRLQPFTPAQLDDLESFICTIPRPPNRYRNLGEELTEAQRRGKAAFERTRTNDGRVIPVTGRCAYCHPPPLYTDGQIHDVGTRQWNDRTGKFDAPHLNNIYDSAPYLHNGMAITLEEIWTKYNAYDRHGVTNDMTKDQLNDLIEYLKTL